MADVRRLAELGMVPELAKEVAAQIENGGGGTVDAADVSVPAITTAGGTTIPAGTLVETLQAIADLADPA